MNKKSKRFLTHYLPFILMGITTVFGFYIRYAEDDLPLEDWTIFPKWFPVFVVMSGISVLYTLIVLGIMIHKNRKNRNRL